MVSKYSKFIFVLLLVSVVLVSGCSQSPTNSDSPDTSSPPSNTLKESACPEGQIQTSSGCLAETAPAENPEENQPADTKPSDSTGPTDSEPVSSVKEFSMTAKQWSFEPSEIKVKKGDQVKLTIKSIDVSHGFNLPDFNVDSQLEPNKETVVEFTADRTGTFTFFCNVFCGSGHSSMAGTLVVE